MPELEFNDFSGGWCPSDDSFSGAINRLLQFDNLCLDTNGAVTSAGSVDTATGITVPHAVTDVYVAVMQPYGLQYYTGMTNGQMYRGASWSMNNPGAGNGIKTAFASAFNYVICCSGTSRVKDDALNTYNLGLPGTNAPGVALAAPDTTNFLIPSSYTIADYTNATPGTTTTYENHILVYDGSESWSLTHTTSPSSSPILTPQTGGGPDATRFPNQMHISGIAATSGQAKATITYGTPKNFLLASDNPATDTFVLYIKQSVPSVPNYGINGASVTFFDIFGNFGTYSTPSSYNWSDPTTVIAKLNQWVGFNALRGSMVGSGTPVDWTQINHIAVTFTWPYGAGTAPTDIYFSGIGFGGIAISSTGNPLVFTEGAAWLEPAANFAVIQTAFATTPLNWTVMSNGVLSNQSDTFNFAIWPNVGTDLSGLAAIEIDILFNNTAPNSYSLTADYAQYKTTPGRIFSGQPFILSLAKSDFTLVNPSGAGWSTVYAVRIVLTVESLISVGVFGSIIPITDVGSNQTNHFGFYGGANSLSGTYQYLAINTQNNGSYLAKGAYTNAIQSATITVANQFVTVTPPVLYPSVNSMWIFRLIGSVWYRIKEVTNSNPFVDMVSDIEAQEINITLDINLISLFPGFFSEPIFSIVGPIQGRWYYFTDKFMYPSDINDPDLINPSIAVRTTNSSNEIFLWASKVAEGYVLVGTSLDIYVLSGTYTTLADGTIDVAYRPIGCKHPPIAYDCVYANGYVYYMATDGIRGISLVGNNPLITGNQVDGLYKEARYGYPKALTNTSIAGSQRYPITVANNRLLLVQPAALTSRVEIYDLLREYWRVWIPEAPLTLTTCTAIATSTTGYPVGAFITNSGTFAVFEMDKVSTRFSQHVNLKTKFISPNKYIRNDFYTLKLYIDTSNQPLTITILTVEGASIVNTIQTNGLQHVEINLGNISTISKGWAYQIQGNTTLMRLVSIAIVVDPRPQQQTFVILRANSLGTAAVKRIRTWPIIIDTLGQDVTFQPIVDGIKLVTQTINTTDKTTVPVFITADAFGVDWSATISGNPFELWGELQPTVVETLPPPVIMDQLGPSEFFRYAKISEMQIRIFAMSSTVITWTLYFDDDESLTGSFSVKAQKSLSQNIKIPKGVAGHIVRLVLVGNLPFSRYWVRFATDISGRDKTDGITWITLPEASNG